MATATVSATIDKRTEELADSYIRKSGLTADKLINQLWSTIAQTGVVPRFTRMNGTQRGARKEAFANAQGIVSKVPRGTRLATMSDDELRAELENRDV
ncbi:MULTISPECIES: hypothetical protein [unclassified Bifidobacterium]|uniref:hypothetical protein n=1 Tax=unclassified Bifidobacterium TaxID=2608897 RepID=UPI0023FA4280|nr:MULTISPECIES: hypothetical protein [unclassified Bifidobacterium]WEV66411.1 hypothetical protein OZX71_03465 [Bifidobacterium sp. ESL0764]WEV76310.1 hypothetical protein OZX75_03775 [Bifidobacterium sp. ESL0800]